MKLELKHISPYFPYGLKAIHLDTEITIHGYVDDGAAVFLQHDSENLKGESNIERYKPILRPLDEFFMVFEIAHNLTSSDKYDIERVIEDREQYNYDNGEYLLENLSYEVVTLLFKHHFDVFGLEEKDLAIDINTIK